MRTENKELMRMAKESLKGKWGLAIGTFLIYSLITGGIGAIPFAGAPASLIIGGPMLLGLTLFTLNISRDTNPKLEQLFHGFKNFGTALGTYLLMVLFITLWSLLLIVPGIIAAISYAMTFFILADDNTIAPMEALRKSKKMMYGYKGKFFCLIFRFFGWFLLCILTLGIGFLWLYPYMQVSFAKFYEDIKDHPFTAESTAQQ
ncbi:MAG TPA: DUF975 family protein [Bacteroidales bacterium]|nr:DUF975 family protein [Bacteroidales bacterium]